MAVKIVQSVSFDKLSKVEESLKASIEEQFLEVVTAIVHECKANHDWLNRTGRLESSIVGVVFRGGRYATTIVSDTNIIGPVGKNGLSVNSRRTEGEGMGRNATQEVKYTGGQQIAAAILAGAPYAAYIEGHVNKKGVMLHVVSHKDEEFQQMIQNALQRVKSQMGNISW